MMDFLSRYSASVSEESREPKDASIFEDRKVKSIQSKAIRPRTDETISAIRSDVSFVMHSSELSKEKPLIIQERVVSSEIWNGHVIGVDEETAFLEVRSTMNPQKRLRLKVCKQIVVGNVSNIRSGMSVR